MWKRDINWTPSSYDSSFAARRTQRYQDRIPYAQTNFLKNFYENEKKYINFLPVQPIMEKGGLTLMLLHCGTV